MSIISKIPNYTVQDNDKNKKILITGVHLTPALAVLDELQARGYNNFVWVGRKQPYILDTKEESLEYKIIKERGIPFVNLITGKLQRTLDLSFFRWIVRIPIGFIQAFFVILKHRPKIVVTFGSYVAVPISFWAWVFRIKIIVHEQVLVGGLSTGIISKFATVVCLSWNTNKKKIKKYIYTGNPIQKSIFESVTNDFNFEDPSRRTLLFMAGKAGSHKLNVMVLNSIRKLSQRYNVIHQTGSNPIADDLADATTIADTINKDGVKYIPVRHFMGGEAYSKSQIVIARSGANTVYELAALGKVAIFIPIPFTQKNEQLKNAELLESVGTATILREDILTPDTLISTIEEVTSNYELMKSNTPKAKSLITLDADKRITDIVEKFLISRNKKVETTQIIGELKNEKAKRFPHPNLEALNKFIDIRKQKLRNSFKRKTSTLNSDEPKITEKTKPVVEVLEKKTEKSVNKSNKNKKSHKKQKKNKKKHK